jgi:hypothetical protein
MCVLSICKNSHTQQTQEPDYLMMTHWLDTASPSTLPPGPTHQVGVGALVLDATGTKVLAVQEKSGEPQGIGK